MSGLPSVLDRKALGEKLDEAMNVDLDITGKDGDPMDVPQSVKESVRSRNVCDTIAEHISQVAVDIPEIESSTLAYGSGDTGRQSKLYLTPSDNVSKDKLREIAGELDVILGELFPEEYLLGITHGTSIDNDGTLVETDVYSLFLVYRTRSATSPSEPAGDSTEVISV